MAKPKSLPYEAAEDAGPWSAELRYTDAKSDKVYKLAIEPVGDLFIVNYANGRYGSTMATGTKTQEPVTYAEARKEANSKLFEQVGKGYLPTAGSRFGDGMTAEAIATIAKASSGHVPQLLTPIDFDDAEALINDDDWYCEVKHNGERRILIVSGGEAIGGNRKGETVALSAALRTAASTIGRDVVLDGEQIGDVFHYWDVISLDGKSLQDYSLFERQAILDKAGIDGGSSIVRTASARTPEEKRAMLADTHAAGLEGVVYKHRHSRYVAGRPNSDGYWRKLKFWASLSAVVGKVNSKRSVNLDLFDAAGGRVSVGNVTIPANYAVPAEGDVAEIRYLHANRGGSLQEPIYEGPRTDIDPAECLMDQLMYKGEARRIAQAADEVPAMTLHGA